MLRDFPTRLPGRTRFRDRLDRFEGAFHRPYLTYRGPGEGCTAATRCCNYWSWGGDSVRPQCCTDHLIELAVYMRDLLDRHGITHWLDWGALLGAVRNGELIPWDNDVDLCILGEDVESVMALREDIEGAGYHFTISESGNVRVYYSRTNTLHLDLYGWDVRGGLFCQDGWYVSPGMHERASFPLGYLESPEGVRLGGHRFPAPSPVERFLVEHRYGPDYLTPTPPPARRWNLVPVITAEEHTSAVKVLIKRSWERERLVDSLYRRGGFLNTPLWERWVYAGMPITPRATRVARLREALAPEDRGSGAEKLLESIDLLDHAIEERDHPWLYGLPARMRRRAIRLLR